MSRASEMQELVDRWKASGLSQRIFTEQQGIGYSRFQYWRRRLLAVKDRPSKATFSSPKQVHLPQLEKLAERLENLPVPAWKAVSIRAGKTGLQFAQAGPLAADPS